LAYEELAITDLRVNQANDRHGEVGSEDLAIAQLFRLHDPQMRRLAEDIAQEGAIFDPPLVMLNGDKYTVFDGNRRVTCAKLLFSPARAPSVELQGFFANLANRAKESLPNQLICQVEDNRDRIDNILLRRHTGSRGGVGQLSWNDRAKLNFVERTGQGGGINVGSEVERLLADASRLPSGVIPWSTLSRLLSSEEFRNRVGISTAGRRFRVTHSNDAVVEALHRITSDLASQTVTLGNLWNNQGKRAYLDRLEGEGVLPTRPIEAETSGTSNRNQNTARNQRGQQQHPSPTQTTFVPHDAPNIPWKPRQHRVRAIWQELQSLSIRTHPNAVSALMRILIELSVENYITDHELNSLDNLSRKVGTVSLHLLERQLIDQAYFDELERIRRADELISIASMQRYIHSHDFAPMTNELLTYWARLHRFLLAALTRES
jgi:hypothetical protein